MPNGTDWNAIFARRKAQRDAERARKLDQARASARRSGKEIFDAQRFRALYARLNADSVDRFTPWDTLLVEAEYDYYVTHADILTLEGFVKHLRWLEGWG